jgi:hypothetical protein
MFSCWPCPIPPLQFDKRRQLASWRYSSSLSSYIPLPPFSQACDVILTFSAHFGESPQRPRPRGPKRARLKEEASLANFLIYGFLIKGLGAELLAPGD